MIYTKIFGRLYVFPAIFGKLWNLMHTSNEASFVIKIKFLFVAGRQIAEGVRDESLRKQKTTRMTQNISFY